MTGHARRRVNFNCREGRAVSEARGVDIRVESCILLCESVTGI